MRAGNLLGAWSVISPHHRRVRSRSEGTEIAALVLRLASVGLLTGVGWIHLHLWQIGYQYIPTIGPLFLAATTAALMLAAGLLIRPSRLIGVAGFGLVVGILAGLIVSVNVGLFGFTESLQAPFAVQSIVMELAAAVTLATWICVDWLQDARAARRLLEGGRECLPVGRESWRSQEGRLHQHPNTPLMS